MNVLWLVWQNQDTRSKYHVGTLLKSDSGGFYFEYCKDPKKRGLTEAVDAGFSPLAALPDINKSYYAPFLFHAFKKRLPNKGRPDYKELLNMFGLKENAKEMELLRVTKGKTNHDSLEFAAPIQLDANGDFSGEFYIEGWRHYDGEKSMAKLIVNEEVAFVAEPANEYDPHAVEIKTKTGLKLGYVAAVYSEFFFYVLMNASSQLFTATVSLINEAAIPQMKVAVLVKGTVPLESGKDLELSPLQTVG